MNGSIWDVDGEYLSIYVVLLFVESYSLNYSDWSDSEEKKTPEPVEPSRGLGSLFTKTRRPIEEVTRPIL